MAWLEKRKEKICLKEDKFRQLQELKKKIKELSSKDANLNLEIYNIKKQTEDYTLQQIKEEKQKVQEDINQIIPERGKIEEEITKLNNKYNKNEPQTQISAQEKSIKTLHRREHVLHLKELILQQLEIKQEITRNKPASYDIDAEYQNLKNERVNLEQTINKIINDYEKR